MARQNVETTDNLEQGRVKWNANDTEEYADIAAAASAASAAQIDIDAHELLINNPHSVTKAQVGLSNADNTSDSSKPVSISTQTALDLKAPLASPTLTGTPTVPTATLGTRTTQAASTEFVQIAGEFLAVNAITDTDLLDDTDFGKVHTLANNGGATDYTVTLPTPSAGNLGKTIFFKGLITLTKVVTLSNGAVTIAGEANWKLSKSGIVGLLSDGTNYVVIAEVGSWIPFVPTWTGFSANPTGVVAKYFRQGRKCTYTLAGTPGTSNTTALTVTAPFIALTGSQVLTRSQNNGTYGTGLLYTDGTNVLTANSTTAAAAYTGSGTKMINFLIEFEF